MLAGNIDGQAKLVPVIAGRYSDMSQPAQSSMVAKPTSALLTLYTHQRAVLWEIMASSHLLDDSVACSVAAK